MDRRNRRRRRRPWLLLVVTTAVSGTTACRSQRLAAPPSTATHNATTGDLAATVDADAQSNIIAALSGTPLGSWVDAATASTTSVPDPCTAGPPALDITLFEEAVTLDDPVLAELLVNADAAFGAARVACAAGDSAVARSELDDAVRTSDLITQRLAAIGHR